VGLGSEPAFFWVERIPAPQFPNLIVDASLSFVNLMLQIVSKFLSQLVILLKYLVATEINIKNKKKIQTKKELLNS